MERRRDISIHAQSAEGQATAPVIENDDFEDAVTHRELIKTLPRLELDGLGRCDQCARVQEKR